MTKQKLSRTQTKNFHARNQKLSREARILDKTCTVIDKLLGVYDLYQVNDALLGDSDNPQIRDVHKFYTKLINQIARSRALVVLLLFDMLLMIFLILSICNML